MHSLDVIIPIKNEANNIPLLVQRIHQSLTKSKVSYQIIFVDDHSTDATKTVVEKLSNKYPIKYSVKKGKPGKAWSILEGAEIATSEYLAMLDADLQYPPEVIPEMLAKATRHGVVVANRSQYKSTLIRRFASRLNAYVFGRFLFGLTSDVQSGLKVFRRDIIPYVDRSVIKPWSFDIPLLFTALELGYSIGSVEIVFETRRDGISKINFLHTTWQIATSAILLRLKKRQRFTISPTHNMRGAGLVHKRTRFITHSTLPFHQSATTTFTFWQAFFITFIGGLVGGGLLLYTKSTLIRMVAILSTIYFLDVLFSLWVTLKSLHFPPEIEVNQKEQAQLNTRILPIYTILCPLYREAHVLPHFIHSIQKLDWPKHRLEVLLLLEDGDVETIQKAKSLKLPEYMRILVVPKSQPKTKPKALNYGLSHAVGKYIVVYDAEDQPDPSQLKIAYCAFQKTNAKTICLQAKLNYYNPHHNLLTKLFTTEYSLWFDMILPGLQVIDTAIPLGGTSNHFRIDDLKRLHGWDAFNVTEDADLGARLFKAGFKTAIIDSTTLEEANSDLLNWVRQRTRWLKGYLQTYFVHMRSPFRFIKSHGIHSFIFQLVMGGKIAFMLINPILWLMTIAYFALYAWVGPQIESLYPSIVFYMAATSLVVGNFLYLYNYMIGTAKRGHYSLIKFVFFIPFYWLMISFATVLAIFQLIRDPHYWEKTNHGLHLLADLKKQKKQSLEKATQKVSVISPTPKRLSIFATGSILAIASVVGNVFNFLYNAYLGREISLSDFGTVSLFGSFLYLSHIPLGALGKTVTWKSAYLEGKHTHGARFFWNIVRKKSIYLALILSGCWLSLSPLITQFFQIGSILPVLLFTPVWLIGTVFVVDAGYLMGLYQFASLAVVVVVEAISKFVFTYILVEAGLSHLVYGALPLSMCVAFLLGFAFVRRISTTKTSPSKDSAVFPRRFFISDIFIRISSAAFISADLILAKHYLSPEAAGQYGILTLPGKMIFFASVLIGQFIVPLVSHAQGEKKSGIYVFYRLLTLQTFVAMTAFMVVGLYGHVSVPILFGERAQPILPYLPAYGLAMVFFTTASSIVTYHQIKREYLFSFVSFATAALQISSLFFWHNSVDSFIRIMFITSAFSLGLAGILHATYGALTSAFLNAEEFLKILDRTPKPKRMIPERLRILIFNWRDTRHMWAGGAEVYLHELATRWVREGHKVTLFSGNDRLNPRNEVIDGVQIVRRGGFYTVYFWAFLYYILRFRGHFDVVIDSENGIPFFTPLYVDKPKFLLIHHVHQEVFREHLVWPLSVVARFIESKLMPFVYRSQKIITVSRSSKMDIVNLGLGSENDIDIVNPGINPASYKIRKKTEFPQLLYLGRLKAYKNIPVLIHAFDSMLSDFPTAKLVIAGEGEELGLLKELVQKLNLGYAIEFTGKVSHAHKTELLSKSWVLVQPSSFEGWGITVIEANASGTPVIASNVAGLKDSVVDGETGMLIPPKDYLRLARALTHLVSRPKLRTALSQGAYNWSREFSWDKSAKKFHEVVLRELIHRHQLPFMGKVALSNN